MVTISSISICVLFFPLGLLSTSTPFPWISSCGIYESPVSFVRMPAIVATLRIFGYVKNFFRTIRTSVMSKSLSPAIRPTVHVLYPATNGPEDMQLQMYCTETNLANETLSTLNSNLSGPEDVRHYNVVQGPTLWTKSWKQNQYRRLRHGPEDMQPL